MFQVKNILRSKSQFICSRIKITHKLKSFPIAVRNFQLSQQSHASNARNSKYLFMSTSLFFFKQDPDSDKTKSEQMLLSSRLELEKQKQKYSQLRLKFTKYVVQPLYTGFRFVYLVMLFAPTLLAGVPILVNLTSAKYNSFWFTWLTRTLELAGPSFVKLGQWAASRQDIFPLELCSTLSKLHSHAPTHSIEYTKQILTSSIGKNYMSTFSSFDEQPIGVGAMAQVYQAKVRQTNAKVAVKVLHPNLERMIACDLKIMKFLADLVNLIPSMEWLSLPGEVETFGVMMQSQLDLRIEAENLNIFNQNFKNDRYIHFPKPYMELCTRDILVEQLVDGIPLEKVIHLGTNTELERKIGELGLNAFLKMLLLHNFIHTDLHAGNIFLSISNTNKDNEDKMALLKRARTAKEFNDVWGQLANCKPNIWFIDAGLVTELSTTNQVNFIDLFDAIANFDGARAGQLMVERSRTPETAININDFVSKTQDLVQLVKQRTFTLGSIGISDVLSKMMHMIQTHHVRLESDFVTVIISILLLEGVGRSLNPDLDIFQSSLPVLRRAGQPHLNRKLPLTSLRFKDLFNMVRVWFLLETRGVINNGVKDMNRRVEYDVFSGV